MRGLFVRVAVTTGTGASATERAVGVQDLEEVELEEAVRRAYDRLLADLAKQRLDDLSGAPAP